MIPSIDLEALSAGAPEALDAMREAATGLGFATVHNTALAPARVHEVIETYRAFFKLPEAEKEPYSMLRGASRSIRMQTPITNSISIAVCACRHRTRAVPCQSMRPTSGLRSPKDSRR